MAQIIRSSFFSLLFLGCLSLTSIGHASVMPTGPKELLALIPKAPANWKLLMSRGYNDTVGDPGLITVANRDYRLDLPPIRTADGTLVPVPPKMMNITLIDTAFDGTYAHSLRVISDTTPLRPGEKRSSLDGVPAVEMDMGGGKRMINIGFADRFKLTLTVVNLDDKGVLAWVKLLDFSALTAAAQHAPKQPLPPRVVSITWLDELNPQSDRTTQMHYQP